MGQRGAPTPHLLPRCSAPLRISPGGGERARTASGAHHAPGTTVTAHPSLSRPGVPTAGTAQEPEQHPSLSHRKAGRSPPPPGAGPVPTCPRLRAGAGAVPALALAGAAAASGGAGSAPRPRVTGGRGGREPASCFGKQQEEKQLSWQPRAPVPALPGPPPASTARPQTAAGGGPGGMEPEGASPVARYVPRHRAQHRLWSVCVHPHPSNNWHCRSPGFLNAPQTREQRAQHAGRGTDAPGMYPAATRLAPGGGGAKRVLLRGT